MISRSLFYEQKVLRIFDFDGTIVETKSHVYVTHKDDKVSKLTPVEYAKYVPKKNDTFDFSEFETLKNPIELKQMTDILRKMIRSNKDNGIFILTSRGNPTPVVKYLRDIGIKNKSVSVVALGSSNPRDKVMWIQDKIEKEDFKEVYFADDSEENINAVRKMLKTKNIKWRTQLVRQ